MYIYILLTIVYAALCCQLCDPRKDISLCPTSRHLLRRHHDVATWLLATAVSMKLFVSGSEYATAVLGIGMVFRPRTNKPLKIFLCIYIYIYVDISFSLSLSFYIFPVHLIRAFEPNQSYNSFRVPSTASLLTFLKPFPDLKYI